MEHILVVGAARDSGMVVLKSSRYTKRLFPGGILPRAMMESTVRARRRRPAWTRGDNHPALSSLIRHDK
jgi:hypothetical protein